MGTACLCFPPLLSSSPSLLHTSKSLASFFQLKRACVKSPYAARISLRNHFLMRSLPCWWFVLLASYLFYRIACFGFWVDEALFWSFLWRSMFSSATQGNAFSLLSNSPLLQKSFLPFLIKLLFWARIYLRPVSPNESLLIVLVSSVSFDL